jgi:branched-chain amino acid transport system ATP-binding protein
MTTVLETEGLERQFGKLMAVDDLLSGRLEPTGGSVKLRPRDSPDLVDVTGQTPYEINRLGLSRAFQINNVFEGLSVIDNLRIARISHNDRSLDLRAVARSDTELTEEARDILDMVNLTDLAETECSNLSHGDKRKVEVALVLLDEPTAGMNATETERMVDLVREIDEQTDTTFVLTEHDMEVVLDISDRILVLDNGSLIADGTPDEVMANETVREAYLGGEA